MSNADKVKEIVSILEQIGAKQLQLNKLAIENITKTNDDVEISDKYVDLYRQQLVELNNALNEQIDLSNDEQHLEDLKK